MGVPSPATIMSRADECKHGEDVEVDEETENSGSEPQDDSEVLLADSTSGSGDAHRDGVQHQVSLYTAGTIGSAHPHADERNYRKGDET